jgi:hypothetical protein
MGRVKRLVKEPENWNTNIRNNTLHQAAFLAEHNLQLSNARAGIDYMLMDCFNLGAFIYLSAKLEDVRLTIANAFGGSLDDSIADSKDISDSDEAKANGKSPFVVGYQ